MVSKDERSQEQSVKDKQQTGSPLSNEPAQLERKINVLLTELSKAKQEIGLLTVKYNQLSETTQLMSNSFAKMAGYSERILSDKLEAQEINSLHKQFSESFKINHLLDESHTEGHSVNDMIGVYLLGAKKNADKIIIDAQSEAESLISDSLAKHTGSVDALKVTQNQLKKEVAELSETKKRLAEELKVAKTDSQPFIEKQAKLKREAEQYNEKIKAEVAEYKEQQAKEIAEYTAKEKAKADQYCKKIKREAEELVSKQKKAAQTYYETTKKEADEKFNIELLEAAFVKKESQVKKDIEQIKIDANSYASKRTRDADSYVRNIKREAEIYVSTTKNDADIYAKIKRDELIIEEKELEKRIEHLKNRFTHQIDQLLDTVDEYEEMKS
ncbi:hypothetical protein [Vagococcus salmoninarum]|uniref:hypothetical protein n=1 Tax=Vagococcus salmoninarum TaxID=2739 RepID=UPI003F94966D